MPDNVVIAIDGPAGSGKSTVAKALAERLNATYIDTGAMYRSVTAVVLERGIDPADGEKVSEAARSIRIEFGQDGSLQKTFVDGVDYTRRIRERDVTQNVSIVSAHANVRESMLSAQRKIGADGIVVMEGRDIGSVVFPEAKYKFFMEADESVRAERRLKEILETGAQSTHSTVLAGINERDRLDSSRELAPMTRAPGAVVINTTNLSIDEVVKQMLNSMVF